MRINAGLTCAIVTTFVTMFVLDALGGVARANTFSFVTAPGTTVVPAGSSALPVSAEVTFIVTTGQVEVRVTNLTIETGGVGQTINSIDFLLNAPTAGPTLFSYSGNAIKVNDPGSGGAHLVGYSQIAGGYASFGSAGNPVQRWAPLTSTQLSGGYSLTTITGSNPAETIIGPENAPGQYQANKSVFQDNPFLQTPTSSSYIDWIVQFNSGVAVSSAISRVRLTWGTAVDLSTETELIPYAPEPASVVLMLSGLLGLFVFGRRLQRRAAARSNMTPDASG